MQQASIALIMYEFIHGILLSLFLDKSNEKTRFSKIRVAYSNVYRKILRVSRHASASGMFFSNDIPNFEAFLRKSIYHLPLDYHLLLTNLFSANKAILDYESLIGKT